MNFRCYVFALELNMLAWWAGDGFDGPSIALSKCKIILNKFNMLSINHCKSKWLCKRHWDQCNRSRLASRGKPPSTPFGCTVEIHGTADGGAGAQGNWE